MTREEFAKKIRWEWIIWSAGIVNIFAMVPQLVQLLTTHKTDGLSLGMFGIYLTVQIAFSLEGFFKRNAMLMWCLGLSAAVNITNISLILYFRHIGG